jgi:Trk K+ transport system NAD-binding subunit
MNRRQRRLLYYVAAFVGAVLVYTLLYTWAMAAFEGQSRSFFESLLVVVETFTTTGYGEDAIWETPQLVSLMVVMQFTGVFFIFMALPLFVAPWIESTLSTSPPRRNDSIEDHVIVCALTNRTETLIDELEILDVPFLVVEEDRDAALELMDLNVPVVQGDPEASEVLDGAGVDRARAVVCDLDDERNAAIALQARQLAPGGEVQIITFAEDPDLARYHQYAGADTTFTPRRLIGESLASKVTTSVTTKIGDSIEIGEDFEIVELPVQAGAPLVNTTIGESGIREETGANVIGAWFRGDFVTPPSPDAMIDERTVLLVAGRQEHLERLKGLTLSEKRRLRTGQVVICGYGEVGATVRQAVTQAGIDCTVVDTRDIPGVDVVGDVTEPEVLEEAGIGDAGSVILALGDDTLAIFATLVIRQLAPEVEVVARANEIDSVQKLYRAGADYVLALPTVSGRMLASTILEEDVISYDQQVEIVRLAVGRLAGESLASADLRSETGCTVVAVERDGQVLTDLDPDFTFERDDEVVVAGPDEGIVEFTALVSG